mmetsp:Transcript_93401/g.129723  ORF Transcript_93401/g.129723 Transcript_93401/m.129723 type:complete len:251 (-) Transcript_93401:144-896(-)
MLQGLCDGFPSVLNQFGGIPRVNAVGHHLIKGQNCTCLKHATQNRLLAHQVALYLGHKGAQQHASTISTGCSSVGLRNVEAIALWIVLRVHSNQGRNSKATLVLLSHLSSWAFGCHHDHCEVLSNSHAFLNDVETVTICKASTFLHHRHDCRDHSGVLLVGCEIADQVSFRDELLIGSNLEAILRGIYKTLAFFLDGVLSQSIAHVTAGVTHVQALVQTLRATSNDDNLLLVQLRHTICELRLGHEAAAT